MHAVSRTGLDKPLVYSNDRQPAVDWLSSYRDAKWDRLLIGFCSVRGWCCQIETHPLYGSLNEYLYTGHLALTSNLNHDVIYIYTHIIHIYTYT